jgi:hypothetical protein
MVPEREYVEVREIKRMDECLKKDRKDELPDLHYKCLRNKIFSKVKECLSDD